MHGAHRLQERQLHERPLRLTALTERPRLRAAAPWIGVGAALLLVVLAESFEALQLRDVSLDFRSYFFASRALAQGANPYDLQTLQRLARLSRVDGLVYPYLYPPLFAEAIGRLGRLAPIMAQRLWALFGVALLAPALTLFVRAWSSPRGEGAPREVPVPRALAAALAVALLPFGHSASLGQVNLVVLALLLYALAAHEARRDALAGVFVGVAACVKVTPILFLAFFVARRRPVAAIACAATVLVCVGGSIAAFGLAPWREFAALLPSLAPGATTPGLYSPDTVLSFSAASFFARWLPHARRLVRGLAIACCAGLAGGALLRALRASSPREEHAAVGLLVVAMIVSAPLTYLHHVVFALPAVLSFAWDALDGRVRPRGLVVGVVAVAVASMNFPMAYELFRLSPRLVPAVASLNLYALLALYALIWRTSAAEVVAA